MILSNNAKTLVRRAKKHGMCFDNIESYKGCYRFFLKPPYGIIIFSSWKELKNYLRELDC